MCQKDDTKNKYFANLHISHCVGAWTASRSQAHAGGQLEEHAAAQEQARQEDEVVGGQGVGNQGDAAHLVVLQKEPWGVGVHQGRVGVVGGVAVGVVAGGADVVGGTEVAAEQMHLKAAGRQVPVGGRLLEEASARPGGEAGAASLRQMTREEEERHQEQQEHQEDETLPHHLQPREEEEHPHQQDLFLHHPWAAW